MNPKKYAAIASLGLAIALGTTPLSAVAADAAANGVAEVFNHAITNIPGKSLIAVEVNYKPGEKSPPHWHAKAAFIMAYVVSGSIRSQVEGEPVHVYEAGQTWYENPGAHHVVSENASKTEPAKLLAVFVVNSKHGALTTFDK
ncbi:cupin domain-containing protein [Castellaniella caeni]|uniref:cupin domain-containing protein n=1 Tax=Castellaniella caeni TaxID=266123 RepID=UPI00083542C5|nr:cupin domain-containing protein [Castellaniella caeni]